MMRRILGLVALALASTLVLPAAAQAAPSTGTKAGAAQVAQANGKPGKPGEGKPCVPAKPGKPAAEKPAGKPVAKRPAEAEAKKKDKAKEKAKPTDVLVCGAIAKRTTDKGNLLLVVKTAKESATVLVTRDTKVFRGDAKASREALKVGTSVIVKGALAKDGKIVKAMAIVLL